MKRSFGFGEGNTDGAVSMANMLMLLSRRVVAGGGEESDQQRVFECKTCGRRFPSFQALGGHRASHKKPRVAGGGGTPPKPRVHECSVCGLEFAIGQALGGHMRRHRAAGGLMVHGLAAAAAAEEEEEKKKKDGLMRLDLNLTPVENDLKLGLGLISFSADFL